MMTSRKNRQVNIYYKAVIGLVAFTTIIAIFGVVFDILEYCDNGAICRFARRFQWETLCAGLYGLAGGLAVIAVSKEQIGEAKESAVKERLFEVDSVISETETVITRITDQISKISTGKSINNPQEANKEYKQLQATASMVPKDIMGIVTTNRTLPISLREACSNAVKSLYPITEGHIFFYANPHDQASIDKEVRYMNDIINKACMAISHCKSERDRYAEILRNR
ncbi:hypothetical protein [Thalassospira marina]|uniref:Uncharacterized protein n=1 Tax=Thalassospira marina TaxID=2048283 RepID=A0A2N3KV57_9PROT|nr:hypothetical protein [Thalassospira marina]PKR54427.1 hypothetical protein COO20_09870 [Thalassospira marina]